MATISGRLLYDPYRSTNPLASNVQGIVNVPIALQNKITKETLVVLTDTDGNYSFINVPNGDYQIVEIHGYIGAITSPGDFTNATIKDLITKAVVPPISYIPSPATGSTHLDCTSPNTLFITVNDDDVTNLFILNGPVKYIPIETIMDRNVIVLDENLITIAENGTFGLYPQGTKSITFADSTYPGIGEGFTFVNTRAPHDGEYTIENITSETASGYTWWAFADHTTGNETGRSMVINGDFPNALLFNETIPVKPHTYYLFSAWILNMIKRSGYQAPALGVRLLDDNGEIIVDRTLGQEIPANRYVPEWVQIGSIICSGDNTTLTVQFFSMGPNAIGNDYALDDVVIKEVNIPNIEEPLLKEINTNEAQIGDTVTYTITLENNYDFEITNISFKDIIPDGLEFIPGTVIINGISEALLDPNDGFAVPDIPSGATAVIKFSVLVTSIPSINPTINTANMTYDYTFIKGGIPTSYDIDSNEVPLNISGEADLSIKKTLITEDININDTLIYLLSITNHGPSAAKNVTITDNIPNELSDVQFSIDNGTSWNDWNNSYNLASLENKENFTLLIKGILTQSSGIIKNTAEVKSDTYDPDLSNNKSTVETPITNEADLSIIKTLITENSQINGTLIYLLTITNHGPSTAKNITITDIVTNDLRNVEFSIDGGKTWNKWEENYHLSSLNNGNTFILLIKGIISTGVQKIKNTAEVKSETHDPDLSNNQSSVETTILSYADLSVIKAACPNIVEPCEYITYTIIISNAGPQNATNVVLNDKISNMICNPKFSINNGQSWQKWNGTLNLGTIAANTNMTILITGQVDACAHGEIVNTVIVSSRTYDPNLQNNEYRISTKINNC